MRRKRKVREGGREGEGESECLPHSLGTHLSAA